MSADDILCILCCIICVTMMVYGLCQIILRITAPIGE